MVTVLPAVAVLDRVRLPLSVRWSVEESPVSGLMAVIWACGPSSMRAMKAS
jgi:hypothetical protein